MTRLRALAAAAALTLAGANAQSQDALERAVKAWERGDPASAHDALLELFASGEASRNQAIQSSLGAFRDAGGTDVWLEAGTQRAKAHPDDAVLQFYLGATWQDLKHLRRAEAALGQALRLAPDNPAVQEAWAWNARLRFDSAAALERSRGASFPGADRFRADVEARLAGGEKGGAVVGLGLLGIALMVTTVILLSRFGHRRFK